MIRVALPKNTSICTHPAGSTSHNSPSTTEVAPAGHGCLPACQGERISIVMMLAWLAASSGRCGHKCAVLSICTRG